VSGGGAGRFLRFFNKVNAFFGIYGLKFLLLKHILMIAEKDKQA